MTNASINQLGAVVIGRNEGARLQRCLRSLRGRVATIVYVDSGSTDDSVNCARQAGADVVELDLREPFTAARARNQGMAWLRSAHPSISFVQVVDGDCEVVPGWIENALQFMQREPALAVVCGRRREEYPDASVFNRLCDMEWNTPTGPTDACGGDALLRIAAINQVGGYDAAVIAGEEPELCLRLRRAGWGMYRLDRDMTLHDARITSFAQWWKRMVRSGYAYARGAMLHGRGPERFCVRPTASIVVWTVLLPMLALACGWVTRGASIGLLAIALVILLVRVARSRRRLGDSPRDAWLYARYTVVGKCAQMLGILRCTADVLRGRRSRIIEYRTPDHRPLHVEMHHP